MAIVTVEDVARAMVADPTRKAQDNFIVYAPEVHFTYNRKTGEEMPVITSPLREVFSCAIGGAALVLGVDEVGLERALARVDRDGVKPRRGKAGYADWEYEEPKTLAPLIIDLNDSSRTSKAAIGERILAQADEKTLKTRLRVAKRRRGFTITPKKAA